MTMQPQMNSEPRRVAAVHASDQLAVRCAMDAVWSAGANRVVTTGLAGM